MADKRADQLKEITERLEQGVKDIFTSEMYLIKIVSDASSDCD